VAGKILVIGSLNMDMVVAVDEIPRRGETVPGGNPAYIPGGKGANQACAAAKLGGKTAMLGMVGDDTAGRTLMDSLRLAGVDVSAVAATDQAPTGTAIIQVDRSGGNCIVVIPGANAFCGKSHIEARRDLIKSHDIVLLQMEIPPDATFAAAELAAGYGKTVILNPAPAPGAIPDAVFAYLDYLIPNETELEKLSGLPVADAGSARAAARRLFGRGVKNLLVTLGSQGALLIGGGGAGPILSSPAPKVAAIDSTAAGDTFVGAFAVALSEAMPLDAALSFANRAAAISVTRPGAQPSMPGRGEM
jgi:ribokinase